MLGSMITPQEYQARVQKHIPRSPTLRMWLQAFISGGLICCLGQLIKDLSLLYLTKDPEAAGTIVSLTLIFLTGLLTALGVFDRIASFAGAGTVVPITGFANSIVSPAMEFKAEGMILGTACKMFQIAGPVLVYGIGSSVIAGILYYLLHLPG